MKIQKCPTNLKDYYTTLVNLMPDFSDLSYYSITNISKWIRYKGFGIRIGFLTGTDYHEYIPIGHSVVSVWKGDKSLPIIEEEFPYIISPMDILYSIDEHA